MNINTNIKLVHIEAIGDWYCIEKAEHENRHWEEIEEYPHCTVRYCMYSGRIAYRVDVEGNLEDMIGIARAITNRSSFEGTRDRCSVEFVNGLFEFRSPRNSNDYQPGYVSAKAADDLVRQIMEEARTIPCFRELVL